MQCKLSKAKNLGTGLSFFEALPPNKPSVIFLSLVLLAFAATVNAQEPSPQATDGTISGIAYLPGHSQPATQVAVSLKSQSAGIFRSVLTDVDGSFEILGLPSGTYEIAIEEQGYQPLRSTVQLDGSSLKLELHLLSFGQPPAPQNANAVSVRELMIPGKAKEEYRKGLLNLAKKEFVQSLNHFTRAARAFPGYFEAFYHQGVAETGLGHNQEAMQAFQEAINLSGGRYARAQFGIGYLYYLQGKPRDAETMTRRGLEVDPNAAEGYVILGMSLLRLNRPDEAEKSAREALLRDANMANAYLILADSNARRGNYAEQINDLDSYLRLDPTGSASKRAHEVRDVAQRILKQTQPHE